MPAARLKGPHAAWGMTPSAWRDRLRGAYPGRVLSGGTIGDVPAWRAVAGSPIWRVAARRGGGFANAGRQRGVCAAPRCVLLSRAMSGAALPSHAGRLSSPAAGLDCGGGFRRAGNWPPSKPAAWQPGHPAPATAAPHPLQPGSPPRERHHPCPPRGLPAPVRRHHPAQSLRGPTRPATCCMAVMASSEDPQGQVPCTGSASWRAEQPGIHGGTE